ncbi:CopG family transcriptional regulator [uncultured Croceicoccus sp.]|uniref:ribbon-helix-helix domain-containing protein n=1 Tax=uncultured Croceicoccus sp. TaxID=1295329 RepID=UPI0026294739|nr:CopG family transcriptional regulator [uncultured Croceicoccus sp.]
MAAKNRVTINLEDEEYEALVDVATRADRSIAWVGRHAIVEFLVSKERKEVPLLAIAGTGSSPFGKPKG